MVPLCLNERRVDTLKPCKSAYDVRDRELKGLASGSCPRAPSGISYTASTTAAASGRLSPLDDSNAPAISWASR